MDCELMIVIEGCTNVGCLKRVLNGGGLISWWLMVVKR